MKPKKNVSLKIPIVGLGLVAGALVTNYAANKAYEMFSQDEPSGVKLVKVEKPTTYKIDGLELQLTEGGKVKNLAMPEDNVDFESIVPLYVKHLTCSQADSSELENLLLDASMKGFSKGTQYLSEFNEKKESCN